MKHTDKQLLDFLQAKNDEARYTGKCVFRMSTSGRGWRLHESSKKAAKKSVRETIGDAIEGETKK